MRIENKRFGKLYNSTILRAIFLEYLVKWHGKRKMTLIHFVSEYKDESKLWDNVNLDYMKEEIIYLENLGLIEFTNEEGVRLTEKGFSNVEKGIFWERMKAMTNDVRSFRNQRIIIGIASLSAIFAFVTLVLKIME